VTPEELHADLIWFAVNGYQLYDAIVKELSGDRRAELERMMRRPGTVQIATTDAGLYVPAAMFYDYPLYDGAQIPEDYEICHEFEQAMDAGSPLDQCPCFAGDCPTRDDLQVVCPSGLWGFRHEVGWPLSGSAASAKLTVEDGNTKLTVGVSTEFQRSTEHSKQIASLGESRIVDSMRDLFDLMKAGDQHLVYLYCHGGLREKTPFVEIGARDSNAITRSSLGAFGIRWENPRPLVFINGCHTTALEPKQAIDLATGFIETANAIGVIGTEITVFEDFAADFAEQALTAFIAERLTIGKAIRRTRLGLLADRNPLGLAYVPFVAADTQIVHATPGPAPSALTPRVTRPVVPRTPSQ
jgi:hypothetical protein